MSINKLILLQILYYLLIFIPVAILIGNAMPEGVAPSVLLGVIIYSIVVYLSLLTVRKKLVPGDEKRLSAGVAGALLGLGLVSLILTHTAYDLVYAVVAYFEIKFFVKMFLKK